MESAYTEISPSDELRAQCHQRLDQGLKKADNRMEVVWYLYQLMNFQLSCENGESAVCRAAQLIEMDPRIGYMVLKPLLVIDDLESANEFVPGILQQPSANYDKLESVKFFDGDSLFSVWEWNDPKNDCDYKKLSPSGLQITVPPGHDLWPSSNRNAPRLLQTISDDFAIETKISDGESGKKSGGLLVWQDEDNYIRFEMPSSSVHEGEVRFEANEKGNYTFPGRELLDVETLILRLERRGVRFSAYCSVDGKNWFTCGWVDLPMDDQIQVGIHALCPQSPATSTRFEYFKILRRDS